MCVKACERTIANFMHTTRVTRDLVNINMRHAKDVGALTVYGAELPTAKIHNYSSTVKILNAVRMGNCLSSDQQI